MFRIEPCDVAAGQQIDRLCQIHRWYEVFDYLHSSPAALAAVFSVVFGVAAYLIKPAIERGRDASLRRQRRQKLLENFRGDVEQTLDRLEKTYSSDVRETMRMQFAGESYVPYQPVETFDVLRPMILDGLADDEVAVSRTIRRYYANDSLIWTYVADYRTPIYAGLSNARRLKSMEDFFILIDDQAKTCRELIGLLPRSAYSFQTTERATAGVTQAEEKAS